VVAENCCVITSAAIRDRDLGIIAGNQSLGAGRMVTDLPRKRRHRNG
jgi:hypothetical protein